MTKKKICLIGSFSVGKTSLARRFVSNEFSEEYLTTLGVKIERREVDVDGAPMLLLVWDLAGRDEFARVQKMHLTGAAGLLFVADGTRKETVDEMLEEVAVAKEVLGDVPALVLLNKADLENEWEISDSVIAELEKSFTVYKTSALTGAHVEQAFAELAGRMITPGVS